MLAVSKLDKAADWVETKSRMGTRHIASEKAKESELTKVVKDSSTLACEQVKGLASQVVKNTLFNCRPGQ